MMDRRATYHATRDQERFVSPEKWDFSIYSFDPRNFWYSKTNLPISRSCEIVRYDFRGRVRFRASLKKPALQINFIDSYSTTASRLQGMGKIDSIVMLTLGGHDWDGISDVGALGIEINLDETAASQVVTSQSLFQLRMMGRVFGTKRSIVARPTSASLRLKQLALNFLKRFDENTGIVYDDVNSVVERPSLDISSLFGDLPQFNEETLLEMSRNVIDEIAFGMAGGQEISSNVRRDIALQIEALLWEPPYSRGSDEDFSLDELAARFGVSRRTVQISLQEQFGVGFVSLRKLIRLHQIRIAMRLEKKKRISELAANFYISHFGRFSKEYKELFGALPSADKSKK